MKPLIAVAALLLLFSPALAQEHNDLALDTGNDMMSAFSACDRMHNQRANFVFDGYICWHLNGYIEGITDEMNVLCSGDMSTCPFKEPDGVTHGQMYDVIRQYLTNHPANRQESSQLQILRALVDAWPKAATPN